MKTFKVDQQLTFNIYGSVIIGKFMSSEVYHGILTTQIITIEVITDESEISKQGDVTELNATFLVE